MDKQAVETTVKKSTLITVMAWVIIAISAIGSLILSVQNLVFLLMPDTVFKEQLQMAYGNAGGDNSFLADFLINHFRLYLVLMLFLAICFLFAAIGLLLRMNWARIVMIGLLVLIMLWNVLNLIYLPDMMSSTPPELQGELPVFFKLMSTMVMVLSVVGILALTVLCAWIVKLLRSPAIRAEFVPLPNQG